MERIAILPQGCAIGSKPHKEHEWREGFLWHRKVRCPGVPFTEKDAWLAANPSIGRQIKDEAIEYPITHKHQLMLTKWNWSGAAPWGQYDQICQLTFTCTSDDCDFEHTLYRWEYDKLVLGPNRTKVYSWPT